MTKVKYEYEYEYESKVLPHLKCDYCFHPLIDPVLASCQHRFCKKCTELASDNGLLCPECGQKFESLESITDLLILNTLNSLAVRCKTCHKTNIPRQYFPEHSEIHRLNALFDQQKDLIKELQNQAFEWKSKYEAVNIEEAAKTTKDSSHLGSLKDVLYDHNQKNIVLKFIYDVESNYRHRYAYMEGDPQRVLQPIEDDQHVSLVTLEQAIEPLDALVTGVRQMVDAVKERCEKLTGSLSLDEAASIMLFSMEAEPIEYCFYRMLNKALQNDDPLKLQPWRDYLRLLIHSLSKLPSVGSQTLYLGIADHINNQYSTGMLFTWKQFSFCATSRKNLEGVFGATGPRTIFRINSCTGKNIRAYSCFPTNDEVLLPAASQFKVIRTEQESTDLCLVLLEEVHCIPSASNSARDQSWQMIVDKSLPSRIDLSGQRLTDELMNTVAEEALIKKRCIEIDLGGNQITSQGVLIISKALNTGVSLQRLYLGGNRIADEGAFYLGPSMCNSSLKVLGLSDCGITDRGAQYLSDMLRAKQTLTVLGLEDNDIGNKGVALLVYGLESNKRLRRLLLARNKAISDSCVNDIINMLGHNQTLQRLDLRDCNLSQNAKERLRRAVRMKNNFDLWV